MDDANSGCPACQAEMPKGAKFCPECGIRVEQPDTAEPEEAAQAPEVHEGPEVPEEPSAEPNQAEAEAGAQPEPAETAQAPTGAEETRELETVEVDDPLEVLKHRVVEAESLAAGAWARAEDAYAGATKAAAEAQEANTVIAKTLDHRAAEAVKKAADEGFGEALGAVETSYRQIQGEISGIRQTKADIDAVLPELRSWGSLTTIRKEVEAMYREAKEILAEVRQRQAPPPPPPPPSPDEVPQPTPPPSALASVG